MIDVKEKTSVCFFAAATRFSRLRLLSSSAITLVVITGAHAQSFSGIGIPAGYSGTSPLAISRDGSAVVGDVLGVYLAQAFRWTAATGPVPLGFLSGTQVTEAIAVSGNGAVTGGYQGFGGCGDNRGVVWNSSGPIFTGFPAGGNYSIIYGLNGDGTVAAGNAGICNSYMPAAVWQQSTNTWIQLPLANQSGKTAQRGNAVALNPAGNIAVGGTGYTDATSQATKWTVGVTSTSLGLGFLSGGNSSGASAISADGSVIVGSSNTAGSPSHAFRYTASGGMVDIGCLGSDTVCDAQGVNSDGSIVVGNSTSGPYRWTVTNGTQSIRDLISAAGLAAGWQLQSVVGVSDSGFWISGKGIDPQNRQQGWIAFLPWFYGTPGDKNCHGKSVSVLTQQYGGLAYAAPALGFASVNALQEAITAYCGN